MKKILMISAAAICIAACNSADKKADTAVVNADSMAKVNKDSIAKIDSEKPMDPATLTEVKWLDSTFLNMGKVKKGQQVEVAFHFKNIGDKPLVITSVTASCGCTVPEKPEQPFTPGAEGVIKAKFDSNNQSTGPHTKTVTVIANTKPQSVHILNFQVDVTE